MSEVLTLILAGESGEKLEPLTATRAKSAIPFGGKFRIIDFTLSNCINSGLRQIYVLTQHRSASLHKHIQEGWNISSSGMGEYIYCVPAQLKMGTGGYLGTADAVKQNLDLIKRSKIDYVLIMFGDHVCKMNCTQFIEYHKAKEAGLTVAAARVKQDEAIERLGIIEVNKSGKIIGFEEKPIHLKSIEDSKKYCFASMGIYIFNVKTLLEVLEEGGVDFAKDIIPKMVRDRSDVFLYDYTVENKIEDFIIEVKEGRRGNVLTKRTPDSSYWQDVSTIDSYYRASMELISVEPTFNLYGQKWPFRTCARPLPPTKCILGGLATESLIGEGSIISAGLVRKSILSPGVIVEKEALVEDSVVFDDVIIEPYANIRQSIIDKEVKIRQGTYIGHDAEEDKRRGCWISDTGIRVVPKGLDIGPV
jgi:glucose-1-phosphate adenylyltransferase